MKSLFTFLFLISFFSTQDLPELRKQFILAAQSKNSATDFYHKLADAPKDGNKTLVAYKGASKALMGKFASKQADKKSYFVEGVQLIEFAVKSEPKNAEIRLIRLSIQENTPKVVKYKGNIAEDKEFLLQNYKAQNTALKEFIKNYILQSQTFSEAEKTKLLNN
ncbi:MAG: hypothetical protein WC716_15975 [Chitinophagaceae bacterium]|jgi:hypothetical protein